MAKTRKVKVTQKQVEEQAQSELEIPKGKTLPPPEPIPDFSDSYKKIATYISEVDVNEEWEEIREWIRRKPTVIQSAMEQLAEQPDMSMRARRLSLVAKRELKRFENEWKDQTQILRELARDHWEQKKKQGMRKQITEAMIDDWILEHYGDTYKELHMRIQDMSNAANLLDHLSDTVANKAPDLRRLCDLLNEKQKLKANPIGSQERKRSK